MNGLDAMESGGGFAVEPSGCEVASSAMQAVLNALGSAHEAIFSDFNRADVDPIKLRLGLKRFLRQHGHEAPEHIRQDLDALLSFALLLVAVGKLPFISLAAIASRGPD